MRYSDIHLTLRQKLQGLYSDREIGSIAFLIAENVTGLTRTQLMLNGEQILSEDQYLNVSDMTSRLQQGEPIQYVLGETEFHGLRLKVGPGVLIPRGETEELVEWVVNTNGSLNRSRIIDIGCGSGAIAIALAKALPAAEVVAADISPVALRFTQENAALNQVKVRTVTLDILKEADNGETGDDGERQSFSIIVSNPPYIPINERIEMEKHVVDYEPEQALFVPDSDPQLFYRALASFAAARLTADGQVFVEIHDRYGTETATVFREHFPFVEVRKDIHGKDRMIRACYG